MRIAITGNEGFIGSRLLQKLNENCGKAVISTFDLKNGKDITKISIPKQDIIFHLAAQTNVVESMEDPEYDAVQNILGTIKVIKENPDAKIILASSIATKDPQSAYGISKLAQMLYCQKLHKNVVICVFSNIFDKYDNGVVGKFIKNDVCKIYGDGLQTRDFVHVNDIVEGLVLAMNWKSGIYELGSEKSYNILELAKATKKELEFLPENKGEIKYSIAKNTTPNWKPKIDVVDYIKKRC